MKMNVNGNVNVLIGLGRFSDAEALIKRQLEARSRVLTFRGPLSLLLTRLYYTLGAKAEGDGCCHSSSWRTLQQSTRKRNRRNTFTKIAQLKAFNCDLKLKLQAEQRFIEAIGILERETGNESLDVARAVTGLGAFYRVR